MKKYVAELNGKQYDLQFEGNTLFVNGEPKKYSFESIGNGLFSLILENHSLPVFVQSQPDGKVRVSVQGRTSSVTVKDEKDLLLEKFGVSKGKKDAALEIHAPMPGLVLKVFVEVGQAVKVGERIMTLEAMKMENELKSSADGTVKAIHVQAGDAVQKNALLVELA